MRVIVRKEDKVAFYALSDSAPLEILEDRINAGVNPVFVFGFLNKNNAIVYEGVEIPADFDSDKYLFDGTTWSLK